MSEQLNDILNSNKEYIITYLRDKLYSENIHEDLIEQAIKQYQNCFGHCVGLNGQFFLTPKTKERLSKLNNVELIYNTHLDLPKEVNKDSLLKLFSLEPYNTQINNIVLVMASQYLSKIIFSQTALIENADIRQGLELKINSPMSQDNYTYFCDNILPYPILLDECYTRLVEFITWVSSLLDYYLIFLDTETCGLDDKRPVQITCTVTDLSLTGIIDSFNVYIQQTGISQGAIDVHHLDEELLFKIGVTPEEASNMLHSFLNKYKNKAILIGHNITFDIKALNTLGTQTNTYFNISNDDVFCTYHNIKYFSKYPRQFGESNNLTNIAKLHGVTDEEVQNIISSVDNFNVNGLDFHNAIYDTIVLYLLFKKDHFMFT